MTRGLEGVEKEIELERARSSALMTTRSGTIEEEWLSEDMSTLSLCERASVGPICEPGVTTHSILKSWRKSDQQAW